MQGFVVHYRPDKGFGFIRCDQLPRDAFFHINYVTGSTVPEVGDQVEFSISQDRDGRPRAYDIDIVVGPVRS